MSRPRRGEQIDGHDLLQERRLARTVRDCLADSGMQSLLFRNHQRAGL
jgi:hypothetical protein